MTRFLTDAKAKEIIDGGKIGRLGCIANEEPYVVPINYFARNGSIYSHSMPGKKIEAMTSNPRVCLQVDQLDDEFHWRSAIAFGRFEIVQRPSDRQFVLNQLFSHFPKLTPVETVLVQDANAPSTIVFRIVIDRITGVEEA